VPGRLDVRILGPLSIERDGAPLALGGMQQRAVLAALLVHEGHVVPADNLIDLLWGESQPPPTARTTVQGYISKIRKLLTSIAPAAVLETERPGYRLTIDPEWFDLSRFEALAESGRAALAGGDPATASRVLTEALELWRGLPLGDLDVQKIGRARPQLRKARRPVAMGAPGAAIEKGGGLLRRRHRSGVQSASVSWSGC